MIRWLFRLCAVFFLFAGITLAATGSGWVNVIGAAVAFANAAILALWIVSPPA